jgi:peptidoglycan DL-endopeptidase CwlO
VHRNFTSSRGWRVRLVATLALAVSLAIGAATTASARPASATTAAAFGVIAERAATMRRSLDTGVWLTADLDRRALAEAVAPFVGVEAWELEDAWVVADPRRQSVVYAALAQLDRPYVSFGDSPAVGFDCSGLTQFAWATVGVPLEHQSEGQAAAGHARTFASAQPGDLLHYPGHVGLYLGAGKAEVHAVNHESGLAVGIANPRNKVMSPIV